MRVVVTGAGGFVGTRLIARLIAEGHSVTGLDVQKVEVSGARIVVGNLDDASVRASALRDGCDALVHLAAVPGGAAEADPALSWRINVAAFHHLLWEVGAQGDCPRVVYPSSIAVFGNDLPPEVDDATPSSPSMIYAGHKAMMETIVTMLSNRGVVNGVTIRLPGIVARPRAPSGLKSAYMSNLFHALKAGEPFTCPVSPTFAVWVQSVSRCVNNMMHALTVDGIALPANRTVMLPALRVTIGGLAAAVADRCGVSADLVTYAPEPALEALFGSKPPLATLAADRAGFAHDGTLSALVEETLTAI